MTWFVRLVLAWLVLVPAASALAGETNLQPFVGASVLDPRHDLPALKQTMGLSVVVQGVRQGSTIGLSFASADALDGVLHVTSSAALTDAARRSVEVHRAVGTLAAIGLGLRGSGGAITWGAQRLSTALTGFTVPFAVGAALDGVAAVLGFDAGIRLRRARLADGVTGVGELARAGRLSEWTHLVCAVLSTFSAISQTLVSLSATDFAVFERRRERASRRAPVPSLVLLPVGAGVGIAGRF